MGVRKFRGKSTITNDWKVGFFTRKKQGSLIVPVIEIERENDNGDYIDYYEIDGNTLGEFSGLKDNLQEKERHELFTDDIILISGHKEIPDGNYLVLFCDGAFCIRVYNQGCFALFPDVVEQCNFIEKLGNIHDNPELLSV